VPFNLNENPIFEFVTMIAYIKGSFVVKSPAYAIIEANGIGYEMQISLNTYAAIKDAKTGKLYTYLHITENGQTFFGFADNAEKEMFLLLIGVSGIGAATARMMLSGLKPNEISKAITQGNTALLSTVKGIGKKTAERLVLELRDKMGKKVLDENSLTSDNQTISVVDDAVQALIALGIARPAAENAVKKIILTKSDLSLEEIIKQSLKNL
jgi:Holliday junction DNA helicase RuvA